MTDPVITYIHVMCENPVYDFGFFASLQKARQHKRKLEEQFPEYRFKLIEEEIQF